MRYFILMRIGLSPLLIMLAMPRHAEAFRAEMASSHSRNAAPSYDEQHAAREGAASRAIFREEGTGGAACEIGEARAKLFVTEARTASTGNQVDAVAQPWMEAGERLKSHTEAVQPLSLIIERLSLYPMETLLAVPASLNAYVHGMLILQGFVRQTEARADTLQTDQADFDVSDVAAKAAQVRAAEVLDHTIAAAHAPCAAAEAETDINASYTASTVTQRKNPAIALAALGVEQRAEVKSRGKPKGATKRQLVEQAVGAGGREAALAHPTGLCAMTMGRVPGARLRPPVHGVIVKGWGEATDAGPATGVFYRALSGARVSAPCGGRVVFANSFRSYGQLLIMDCGGGYHMILSGLEKLDVQSGQTIGAGEAVGVMAFSESGSTTRRQVLCVELRHNGHPVNPTPWLRDSS